jgi:ParB-like chromosome segregation protein Spo0J
MAQQDNGQRGNANPVDRLESAIRDLAGDELDRHAISRLVSGLLGKISNELDDVHERRVGLKLRGVA